MTFTSTAAIKTATTPLTPDEILKYRSMTKSAIVLIMLWRLGRPSGSAEIAHILGLQRETVAGYLKSLALIGMVTRTELRDGYRLTQDGKQLTLQLQAGFLLEETHVNSFANQPHALTLHSSQSAPATSKALATTVIDGKAMSEIPTFTPGETPLPGSDNQNPDRMSEKPTLNVGKTDARPLKKDFKKEEDLNSLKEKSSFLGGSNSANVGKTDISKVTELTRLLKASYMLFDGDAVVMPGLDLSHVSRQAVLGWLAQAYDQKAKLDNPPGLVYTRLKEIKMPEHKYLTDWERYLPTNYLVFVGILKEVGPEPEEEPEPQPDPVESSTASDPDPVLDVPVSGSDMSPRQAWKFFTDLVQPETPRTAFSEHVEPAVVTAWDEAGALMTVSVDNALSRDWLEDRLTSMAQRLLAGILDRKNVTIRFVEVEK